MPDQSSRQENGAERRQSDTAVVKLLEDIFATRPDEIQCDEVADLIVQCADRMLSDQEARTRYAAMFHHFRYCQDCADEYAMVVGFARDEAAGLVERPAYIPPPPLYSPRSPAPVSDRVPHADEKQPSVVTEFLAKIKGVLRQLSEPAFSLQPSLVRGEYDLSPGEEPLSLLMEGEKVTVTLTVQSDANTPSTRVLTCFVETSDEALEVAFGTAEMWLTQEDGESVGLEQLSAAGDVTFYAVHPGIYELEWSLGGQDFQISGVTIT